MSVVLALLLDALLGEPRWLWSRVPHPAVIMGQIIGAADRRFNTGAHRQLRGALVCAGLVSGAGILGWLVTLLPFSCIIEVLLGTVLLAQKSLVQHVGAVSDALRLSVGDARRAVAMIVGRDTTDMDGPAIARGAIESAAENFSDGVVAPVFWFVIGGLPGLMIYKIVNTADSMIGYRTPRHGAFGWASARLDDVLNWLPARLTALLILLSHGRIDAASVVWRDAGLHRSPNAGWPESAMAPVIGVALSGPRSYEGEMRDFPFVFHEGRHNAGPGDIDAASRVLWRSWAGLLIITIIATAL